MARIDAATFAVDELIISGQLEINAPIVPLPVVIPVINEYSIENNAGIAVIMRIPREIYAFCLRNCLIYRTKRNLAEDPTTISG